jgi:hypothetical protein
MKKTITGMLALMAGAFVAHGQGNVVFGDYGSTITPTYILISFQPQTGSPTLLGGSATGPAPTLLNYAAETGNGNDWTVQLYEVNGTGTPVPLSGITANFSTVPGGTGMWSSTLTPSFPSTTVTLQLAAWYNDGGTLTSYSQAQAAGVPVGESTVITTTILAAPTPPGNIPEFPNFSVSATPEPSTIALGVIGASAFLMRLRRKQ